MSLLNCIIFYFSGSGNTKLACQLLSANLKQVQVDLCDVAAPGTLDMNRYDMFGFAFPTHYSGVPEKMLDFVKSLPDFQGKPAFLLNTYGLMQGKGLKTLEALLIQKGLTVMAWHALMMPEAYPPFIAKGWGSVEQPDEKQMAAYKRFIAALSARIDLLSQGAVLKPCKIKLDLFNRLIGGKSKEQARKEMGALKVDASKCDRCAVCVDACVYGAVRLEGSPVFETQQCRACWACFNHCPQQAIFIDKVSAVYQYPKPSIALADKFTPEPMLENQ